MGPHCQRLLECDCFTIEREKIMKTAFAPIVDSESKILILGTMPGIRSLELQQYYGHSGNHFWKILFRLFDEPFTNEYDKRIDLLHRIHIAKVKEAQTRLSAMKSQMILRRSTRHIRTFNTFFGVVGPPKNFTENTLAWIRLKTMTSYRHQVVLMQVCRLKRRWRNGALFSSC